MGEFSFERYHNKKGSPSLEGGTSVKHGSVLPSPEKKLQRQKSALGNKLYDAEGSVIQLNSTKDRTVNFAPPQSAGTKISLSPTLSFAKNEQLSTEETEVRRAVLDLEAQIQQRA